MRLELAFSIYSMDSLVCTESLGEYFESLRDFCVSEVSNQASFRNFDFSGVPMYALCAHAYNHKTRACVDLYNKNWSRPILDVFPSHQDVVSIDNSEEMYREAEGILEMYWPEIYEIFSLMVFGFHRVEAGRREESYSLPQLQGLVFYKMDSKDPLKWAEIMVHELAHQILFALTAVEGFLPDIDWAQKQKSAIRQESRPLIGLYHGLIAQAFMLKLSKLVKAGSDPILLQSSERIFKFFSTKFIEDKETVSKFLDTYLDPFFDGIIEEVSAYIEEKTKIG